MKVDLNGDFEVSATTNEAFAFITAPERFAPVLPYFKELRDISGRHFTVVLEVGVPQIRGIAEVNAELVETDPPYRAVYTIKGRHALGMMDSTMTFLVAEVSAGSKVTWQTESIVSGTLASLAQGILLPLAKRQIKSLVASVRTALGSTDTAQEPKAANILGRSATSFRGLFGKNKIAPEGAEEKLP